MAKKEDDHHEEEEEEIKVNTFYHFALNKKYLFPMNFCPSRYLILRGNEDISYLHIP